MILKRCSVDITFECFAFFRFSTYCLNRNVNNPACYADLWNDGMEGRCGGCRVRLFAGFGD